MPYLQFFRLTGSRWNMFPINTSYFSWHVRGDCVPCLQLLLPTRTAAAGTGMCVAGARFLQSNFYVSHGSIVLRAVQGKGHEANPTCWELSHILVCNLLAGWGATFATGHRYYFDSQKALSSWVYLPTRNKMIPLWSLISTPYYRLLSRFVIINWLAGLPVRLLTVNLWKQHQNKTPSFSDQSGEISSTFQFLIQVLDS